MPLGETLPKSGKSEDWLAAADAKRDEIMKEAGKGGLTGTKVGSPLWKTMSDKEVQLRNKGMALKRQELKRMSK